MKIYVLITLFFISMVSCDADTNEQTKEMGKVKIQLVRNATMKIEYTGKILLTDPMLSPKASFMSFVKPDTNLNPTIDLTMTTDEILSGVDAVLVSHAHPDHFDPAAIAAIKKSTPLFYQPVDETVIAGSGFTNATAIETEINWEGITMIRTGGVHGPDETLEMLGQVSGFVLKAENFPTIYWIGDCLYDEEIENNIKKYDPDIIITHSGGAIFMGQHQILMNEEETIKVAQASKKTTVVAIHMESLDHCPVTRESLKNKMQEQGIDSNKIRIPDDGETIEL